MFDFLIEALFVKKEPVCRFCKGSSGEITRTKRYDIYDNERWSSFTYHQSCLEDTLCEPEDYSHRLVDLALDIVNSIERGNRILKEKKQRVNEACVRLRSQLP